MLQQLTSQLIHDLKVSWKKTAVLGVLLAVGLCFWIPLLVRAVAGEPRKADAAVADAVVSNRTTTAPLQAGNAPTAEAGRSPLFHWATAEKLFESDPLLQSVAITAGARDPFQIDTKQFPPPVLFAEDAGSPNGESVAQKTRADGPRTLKGAVLKSTVISPTRRAAFINSRLYYVGRTLNLGGETYHVAAIYPRRVVLQRGHDVYELLIEPSNSLDAESVRTVE